MPKTRRTKTNRSPGRPYRNSKAYVAVKGDMITTIGIRGRTVVKRVTDETGKRLTSVRITETVAQPPAPKGIGDDQPIGIFVGRQYTGVARGKPYPYGSTRQGYATEKPISAKGLMGGLRRAAGAVKRVVVKDPDPVEVRAK